MFATKSDKSLNRTRSNIKNTIDTNVTKYSKFITFTYAKTNLSREKLRNDFNNFKRRFKEYYNEDFKYVGVIEHQRERGKKENNEGSLHLHLVVFVDQKLDYKVLKDLWKQGSVDLKKVDSTENLGLYLMKYITKEIALFNKKSILKSRDLKTPIVSTSIDLQNLPQPKYTKKYDIKSVKLVKNSNLNLLIAKPIINHVELTEYILPQDNNIIKN